MATLRVKVDPTGAISGSTIAKSAIEEIAGAAHGTEEATEDLKSGFDRFRKSIDPIYAATRQYEGQLETLNSAYRAGIVGQRQYVNMLNEINLRLAATEDAAQDAAVATSRFGKGLGGASGGARGFAMQLSQVVDMGVATGQWGRSFFMQMSDIAMLFGGPLVIALGSAVSVLGMVGLSFLQAREESEDLIDDAYNLSDGLRVLGEMSRVTASDMETYLVRAFGESADELERLLAHLESLEMKAAMQPIIDGLRPVRGALNEVEGALRAYMEAQSELAAGGGAAGLKYWQDVSDRNQQVIADNLALAAGMEDVGAAINAITQSKSPEELAENLSLAIASLEGMTGDLGAEARQALIDLAAEAGVLEFMMSNAAGAAERFGSALKIGGENPMTAYSEAERFAPTGAVIDRSDVDAREARDRRESESAAKAAAAELERIVGAYESTRAALDKSYRATKQYRDAVETLDDALRAGKITQDEYNEVLGLAQERLADAEFAATDLGEAYNSVADTIESSMESAFMSLVDGTMSAKDAFRSMARDIIAEAYRMMVVRPIINGLFGGGGGGGQMLSSFFGGGGNFFGSLFGARANGGPVATGEPYLVGERGPELFVPSSSGNIQSNRQMGGSVVNNYSYTFTGGVTEKDLRNAIPAIVEASSANVLDKQLRGGTYARAF